ncbi:MAG: nucleotidyltransferase domain-containing protein [Flavobacteriales bacterium]|nr:nucleotidyltransferase domain-containing protein [Flavobacteriales bacterium]
MLQPAIPETITTAIQRALIEAERSHDVKVLLAVESGSRAWGFASPDSDWDVRFIYVHRPEWYLSIDAKRDVIEAMLPMDIDLAGWDLRKALQLFRKSNPPLLEWLRSPLLYTEQYTAAAQLRQFSTDFFRQVSVSYHYLSMGKRNYANYLTGEQVRLKKYLYVLRPLLACDWIANTGTMAPMEFHHLLDAQLPTGPVREAVDRLLRDKMSGGEMGSAPRDPLLHQWIEQRLAHYAENPPTPSVATDADTARLDRLFQDTLKEVWRKELVQGAAGV